MIDNDTYMYNEHNRILLQLIEEIITLVQQNNGLILLDFSLTVKAAPHECVIRTSQP